MELKTLVSTKLLHGNGTFKKQAMLYIEYIPNKYLAQAVLPSKDERGNLCWNLKPGEGVYTTADIETALLHGYEIKVKPNTYCDNICGYYWNKSKYIFKKYITEGFKKKNNSTGAVKKMFKLFLNALYGKLIQRPVYTSEKIVKSVEAFYVFYDANLIQEIKQFDNGSFYLAGYSRDEAKRENDISKPSHLGAFVLSFSRRIMMEYYVQCNPFFDISKQPESANLQRHYMQFYTDTDSMVTHQKNTKDIKLDSKTLGGYER